MWLSIDSLQKKKKEILGVLAKSEFTMDQKCDAVFLKTKHNLKLY